MSKWMLSWPESKKLCLYYNISFGKKQIKISLRDRSCVVCVLKSNKNVTWNDDLSSMLSNQWLVSWAASWTRLASIHSAEYCLHYRAESVAILQYQECNLLADTASKRIRFS